jgi:hypothetical protein
LLNIVFLDVPFFKFADFLFFRFFLFFVLFFEHSLHLAEVFKEGGPHEGFLVFFYRDLGDFEDEVQQEDGHVDDFAAHDLEQASEFSCGHVDEVNLFLFSGLFSYELFALDVIVFAEELEELEGASVGGNAEFVVKVLIGGVGLEHIFPEAVSLGGIKEVVVINGGGAEVVFL